MTTIMAGPKVTYVVINENILAYIREGEDQKPAWQQQAGVLHASVLRGAPQFCDTIICLPTVMEDGVLKVDESKIRPATRKDFEDYRVCLPPDMN